MNTPDITSPQPPFWVRFRRQFLCWRALRRALIGLAIFATLIALFYTEENIRGRRAWEAYKKAQEAKGEKFDPLAFIPPPIPDEQNLALSPLLKPLTDITPRPGQGLLWRDTNGIARIHRISTDWTILTGTNPDNHASQKMRMPRSADERMTNGWVNLAAWQAYYRVGTNLPGVSAAEDVLLALGPLEADLAELARESAQRPLARWPVKYDAGNPFSSLLPHLGELKRLVQVLQLRAAARLAAGDTDGGLSDIALGFRLGDTLRDEPILISQLVRNACLQIMLQPLKEGLARHQFTEAQLADWQARCAAPDLLAGYVFATKSERNWNTQWDRYIREGGFNISDVLAGDESEAMRTPAALRHLAPRGWIFQNQLVACRLVDEIVLPAVDVQTRRYHLQAGERLKAEMARTFVLFRGLAQAVCPAVSSLGGKFVRVQVQLDCAVLACALERHRLAAGRLPDSMDALVPQFIGKLPHDPVGGGPFRYRPVAEGGYLLYSVGLNGTDDGGSEKKPAAGRETRDGNDTERNEPLDWVWRCPPWKQSLPGKR